MSALPVPVRDFTSLMKTLFSPSGDNRSATMNETPDVEQARHQELDHGHCQQQQCRGDEGRSGNVASAAESKPTCEPGGALDIAELQASDSAYQIAAEIHDIFSYVTRKQYLGIKRVWKETVFAIKSDDSSLEEELLIRLEQQCHAYYDSILKQSWVNHLSRGSKAICEKFIYEQKTKLGADVEHIEENPSCYIFYGQHDVPHAAARRFLEFSWVYRSLAMFQRKTTSSKDADYIHFADEVILVIKMLLMLLIIIVFVYVPVIISGLGVVSSQVGISILYFASISLSCVVTTLTLDVNTALAVDLAYAGILGNVLFQKGAA
ncbi:uncharacterized protein TrAFT101_008778 [Trichoderma asperellum]|uniref:Uncharacterized protein n=1 Tax=Trichoderma asperellum (strain ATCC 204424 / CBS 433.97 / NBRC 101777) TaxID=1042311 RepID=A0A2T3ZBD6_TRIA4|nr:hypothetical protein M441DRAFT_56923 [Trichoderma asperellum CBS 433.97]PTB42119.1 hypothetical protein M441DRAFT_56923 [Trichoderma asperellum CBS 433.97]UKZ93875.1 hypothetical protein TrAFT101_008778 [Trichoderma asperellum]